MNKLSLLTIDPGTCAGVAEWSISLKRAYIINAGSAKNYGEITKKIRENYLEIDVDVVVIELPQIYKVRKVDPNDLARLAALGGELAEASGAKHVEYVLPAEWKGQTPKAIAQARAHAALTAYELKGVAAIPQKTLAHNMWDAIGIGLARLGRLPGGALAAPSVVDSMRVCISRQGT